MKLPLAYYGDPILRKKCPPVERFDDEFKQFVKDMEETVIAHDGLGLAAPQCKRSIALFITNVPQNETEDDWSTCAIKHFVNPKILEYSADMWGRGEGCLSIPGLYGVIYRPLKIKVRAYDIEGNEFTGEYKGLQARAIMHENDHINGVLFIDRIKGKERLEMETELKEIKKRYLETNK
jgi:peptide deformylase